MPPDSGPSWMLVVLVLVGVFVGIVLLFLTLSYREIVR
jgi:hypothetical protein